MSTAPGWYDDGSGQVRWWDGERWTEHAQPPAGVVGSSGSGGAGVSAPTLAQLPGAVFRILRANLKPLLIILLAISGAFLGLLLPIVALAYFTGGLFAALFAAGVSYLLFSLGVGALGTPMMIGVFSGQSGSRLSESFRFGRAKFGAVLKALLVASVVAGSALVLVSLAAAPGVPAVLAIVGPFVGLPALATSVLLFAFLPAYVVISDAPGAVARFVRGSWAGWKLFPAWILMLVLVFLALLAPGILLSQVPVLATLVSLAASAFVTPARVAIAYLLVLRIPR
jgi:hypothetical protein